MKHLHHVDVLQWLFGPITEVSAVIGNRLNRLEAEDTLVASFRTQSGSLGTIEATTAARPRDFEASLTVTAEGGVARVGGIAREHQQAIFQEFFRVSQHQGTEDSLGLGLTIVSKLTSLMGYQLALNSEANKGSVFRVMLPAFTQQEADTESRAPVSGEVQAQA